MACRGVNMKNFSKTLMIILSLRFIIFLSSTLREEHFSEIEYEVRVINGFTNNSSLPLVIWCISQDMDLGGRALQERDDYSWNLKASLWGLYHYQCTMKWDDKRKRFDAFKFPRDFHRCGPLRKCSWLVREDGFYFSNDNVFWKKDFSWS
ncbi:S-protein homolog 20-like [Rutidosis leptorrhynchoides]|uniref:S-protein homolog 20-like n=1 Tax=Rutidosis leptorrhynchoides TaxID=125765 RepID=UPI003A991856